MNPATVDVRRKGKRTPRAEQLPLATKAPAPATPVLDHDRRAHRAVRDTVFEQGTEAPRVLYEFFDFFNAMFFGGALGAPLIFLAHASSPRAAGDYSPRDIHGLVSRIRIAPVVFRRGWRHAVATLLHEMVHAWQHEIEHDTEPGYKGHGPKFTAKANEIGKQLGFPECAPKGRNGKERAETWPELPKSAEDLAAEKAKAEIAAGNSIEDVSAEDSDGGADDPKDLRTQVARLLAAERIAAIAFLRELADGFEQRAIAQKKKPRVAEHFRRAALCLEQGIHRPDLAVKGGTDETNATADESE